MVREEIVDDSGNGSDDKESDLLCLSPSRLALAFGILLVILLLALLASCTLWMRARAHLKRPKPIMTNRPPRPPAGISGEAARRRYMRRTHSARGRERGKGVGRRATCRSAVGCVFMTALSMS